MQKAEFNVASAGTEESCCGGGLTIWVLRADFLKQAKTMMANAKKGRESKPSSRVC